MLKWPIQFFIYSIYAAMLIAYMNYVVSPSQFIWVSFFGLAYPIIILCFFVALFFAYSQSKRLFLSGIAILLVGYQFHLNYFSFGQSNEPTTEKSFKILSYNVRLFDRWAKPNGETKSQIFDYLKEEDADVYCFQEFYYKEPPTKFNTRDTLKQLLKTPYLHEHYSFYYRGKQYYGVTMMSKFPMITKGDVSFEDTLHQDHNYCIYADLVPSPGDTVRVYNAHFQSIKISNIDYVESGNLAEVPSKNTIVEIYRNLKRAFLKRQFQTDKVLEHIKNSPYRVILTGDFNDTPTSYAYLQFSKYLKDAFRENRTGIGGTYAGKLPVGRIDYIFHSDSLNSYDFEIQHLPLSDHYAITTKVNY